MITTPPETAGEQDVRRLRVLYRALGDETRLRVIGLLLGFVGAADLPLARAAGPVTVNLSITGIVPETASDPFSAPASGARRRNTKNEAPEISATVMAANIDLRPRWLRRPAAWLATRNEDVQPAPPDRLKVPPAH